MRVVVFVCLFARVLVCWCVSLRVFLCGCFIVYLCADMFSYLFVVCWFVCLCV